MQISTTSVWEAMAMEKPIVSTDVGDVSTYIMNGDDGFIVPPCDSQALAKKVEILIKNDSLRKKFSSRVRNAAVEYLDIDICVKKHIQAYMCILNHFNGKIGGNGPRLQFRPGSYHAEEK